MIRLDLDAHLPMLESILYIMACALFLSLLLFSHLALHGECVRDLLKCNLSWPVNFNTEQERTPLFRLKDSRLLRDDMQHCIIAHALVDEWYVYSGRQLLVDIHQLLHQEWPLVFKTN